MLRDTGKLDRTLGSARDRAIWSQTSGQALCGRVRRYLGQLLEGEEALAALGRGVQLLQAAVDAQVRPTGLGFTLGEHCHPQGGVLPRAVTRAGAVCSLCNLAGVYQACLLGRTFVRSTRRMHGGQQTGLWCCRAAASAANPHSVARA